MPPIYAHDPFLLVNHALARPWLDPIMAVITTLCEGWAIAILALVWVSYSERRRGAFAWSAVVVLAALATDGVVVVALKHLAHTPRPLAVLGPAEVHVVLSPLHVDSFPSGHSSAAAVLATFGTRRVGARRALVLWALAFLGGLSRIYVGAHWTLDVLAGWTVGVLVTLAVYEAARRIHAPAPLLAPLPQAR